MQIEADNESLKRFAEILSETIKNTYKEKRIFRNAVTSIKIIPQGEGYNVVIKTHRYKSGYEGPGVVVYKGMNTYKKSKTKPKDYFKKPEYTSDLELVFDEEKNKYMNYVKKIVESCINKAMNQWKIEHNLEARKVARNG